MGRAASSEEDGDEIEAPEDSEARNESDAENEDDTALQQALALSMGASLETRSPRASKERKGKPASKSPRSPSGARSSKRMPTKQRKELKCNESEVEAFFVAIVGSKTGKMSLRHLENAASAQDFTWTEEQLRDMIDIFDKDKDGQLNLAEFRSMTERCKLVSSASSART